MISQEEYRTLLHQAVQETNRLMALGVRDEDLVWVMTYDVYIRAMSNDERWRRSLSDDSVWIRAQLNRRDIDIVNEDVETMFKPAVKGMDYYTGMRIGDAIIINEDDGEVHLYNLASIEPTRFEDSGLTVRFEDDPTSRRDAIGTGINSELFERLCTNGETNRNGIMYSPSAFAPSDGYYIRQTPADWITPSIFDQSVINELERQFNEIGSGSLWSSIPSELRDAIAPKRKKRPAKEQEKPLTPEDTNELDEFLNSFARKPTLESAT